MSRSRKLRGIYILLAVAAGGRAETDAKKEDDRPNIVWIMAEDMALDLECYGMKGVRTPRLNRLAEEGALYMRAYCSNPICSPSRSAMMTGVHQQRINAQHHRSNRDTPLPDPYKPITYWLRKAGYTCILGNSQVMSGGNKIDCNFKWENCGPYDGKTNFGLFDKQGSFSLEDQPFFAQIQLRVTHRGDWWEEIRSQSKSPVSPAGIELPPYFADTPEIRYDWAVYCDQIEYMDYEVGLLIDQLKEKELYDNTVIIFIADNGRCNLRAKGYLYDPGIHIPMIVRAPGMTEPGTVVEEMVLTTDISASVLHLAGAGIPDYITSKPVIGVESPEYREYICAARDIWDEIDDCSRNITTRRFSYIKNYMPQVPWATDQAYLEMNRPALWVMRRLKRENALTPARQLFFADSKPPEELYDLQKDPHQLRNLADDPEYASVLERMRAFSGQWQRENRDYGMEDLGARTLEENQLSVRTRDWIRTERPDLWARMSDGELMQPVAWMNQVQKQDRAVESGKK